MLNPMLCLSMFKKRTRDGRVYNSQTLNVYGSSLTACAEVHLSNQIELARKARDEHYWSFARYAKSHTKDDIIDITAVVLSFPYTAKADLLAKLASFPYSAYLIHAQAETAKKRPSEQLVIAVVFDEPITSTDDYTRIAALLSQQLGIAGHAQGDYAATFLFAPYVDVCSEPKVTLIDSERTFLNAARFLAENKGVWANARAMQVDVQVQPEPQQVDDEGLFQW